MLCGGHILIEDVPGVGKTKLVAALSKSVDGRFNRIQLTPDIMPSDIVGFSMINPQTKEFEYRAGAAMCNFLLADEINRASPKAQSALLEIMEEHQISLDSRTIKLPEPFMTLATQNPVETYGTYHLPEAQMDRFLMKLSIGYPSYDDEMQIIERNDLSGSKSDIPAVLSLSDVVMLQKQAAEVKINRMVRDFIVRIITATRNSELIRLGASPRGSIALTKAAKAYAFINGRDFATPDDVNALAGCVLSHRIILSPKGKSLFSTPINVIAEIIKSQSVPML
jgi:MoxR-like ATPase